MPALVLMLLLPPTSSALVVEAVHTASMQVTGKDGLRAPTLGGPVEGQVNEQHTKASQAKPKDVSGLDRIRRDR